MRSLFAALVMGIGSISLFAQVLVDGEEQVEFIGLESVTAREFSDIVKKNCAGKY